MWISITRRRNSLPLTLPLPSPSLFFFLPSFYKLRSFPPRLPMLVNKRVFPHLSSSFLYTESRNSSPPPLPPPAPPALGGGGVVVTGDHLPVAPPPPPLVPAIPSPCRPMSTADASLDMDGTEGGRQPPPPPPPPLPLAIPSGASGLLLVGAPPLVPPPAPPPATPLPFTEAADPIAARSASDPKGEYPEGE